MVDDESEDSPRKIISFPQSRTKPAFTHKPKELGLSALAKQMSIEPSGLKGHWCSQCNGIWYGLSGECECPACENRNG